MFNLLEKYGFPVYSQTGGGPTPGGIPDGGGGDDLGGGGDDLGDPDESELPPIYTGEEGEVDENLTEIFGAFKPEGDSEVDDTVDMNAAISEIPPEQVKAVDTEVKAAIQKMQFPESMIPADFNPNDRAQFKAVMDNGVRAAVAQALGVVFKPVQLALGHMVKQTGAQMDSKIKAATTGLKANNVLADVVPEINMPQYSGMVQSMNQALQKQGKKPAERAQILRRTLNQMGIKGNVPAPGNRRVASGTNPNNGVTQTKRQGTAALDSFFGKFSPPKGS